MRIGTSLLLLSILLPVPAMASDMSATGSGHDWSGVYAGIQTGGYWNSSHWTGTFTAFNTDGGSALIGGQVGYNRQYGNWVVGVEGEISATFLSGEDQCSTTVGSVCRTRQDWVAAIRPRIGYARGRLLFYGTAGVAFTDYNHDQTVTLQQSWNDGSRVGWTAGLGAEYALSDHWTAGIEWKHYDFGTKTGNGGISPASVSTEEVSDYAAIRINYKF